MRGERAIPAIDGEPRFGQGTLEVFDQFGQGHTGKIAAGPEQMVATPIAETVNVQHERCCAD